MKIAILGCGVMGSAFALKLSEGHEVYLYDRNLEKANGLAKKINGKAFENAQDMVKNADALFLAVKPKDLSASEKLIGPLLAKKWLFSMLSGITTKRLQKGFPESKVVRIMPTLPMIYGKGVMGIIETPSHSKEDRVFINELLKNMGMLQWITEDKMDALTALTGSGPAFVLYLLEATMEAGVLLGFSPAESQKLSIETFKGALSLMESGNNSPKTWMSQITSAGGTTIAGLHALDDKGVKAGVAKGFLAAKNRSREISESEPI